MVDAAHRALPCKVRAPRSSRATAWCTAATRSTSTAPRCVNSAGDTPTRSRGSFVPTAADMPPPTFQAAPPPRLDSLDAYRGLIMLTLLCGGIFHSLAGHPIVGLAGPPERARRMGRRRLLGPDPAGLHVHGRRRDAVRLRRARRPRRHVGSQARHALRRAAMLVADRRPARSRRRRPRADRLHPRAPADRRSATWSRSSCSGARWRTQAARRRGHPRGLSGAVDGQPLERAGRPVGPAATRTSAAPSTSGCSAATTAATTSG